MYDIMVLSGGGIKGFYILGAIQYLMDKQMLNDVHKIIGTSVGAIIGYLYCIGFSPTEIMIFFCSHPETFKKIVHHTDLTNMLHGFGILSYSSINDILEKMTLFKLGKYMNLQELYEFSGIELVCSTYNLTSGTNEYVSYQSHPSMSCFTALRMSSNLPFIFDWFHYDGCEYLDGGIGDNFPFRLVDPSQRAIGIWLKYESAGDDSSYFLSRLIKIIHLPVDELTVLKNKESFKRGDIVEIVTTEKNPVKFMLTTSERFDMFSEGYQQTSSFFSSKPTSENPTVHTK